MERILIIADNLDPLGPTGEVLPITRALVAAGHEVCVIPLQGELSENGMALIDSEVMVLPVKWPDRFSLSGLSRLRKIQGSLQPTQIHCWGERSCNATAWMNLRATVKTVAIHSSSHHLLNHQNWASRLSYSRFDTHLLRTSEAMDRVKLEFPNWQVGVLPRTSEWLGGNSSLANAPAIGKTPAIGKRSQGSRALKEQLGIPQDAFLVGTAAPLLPRTRVKDFIWAADLLTCIRNDVYWLAIGNGSHQWRLEKFASQLEVGDHFRIIDWNSVDTMASQLMRSLDVYVECSDYFDGCRGLVTAVSNGVPCVATTQPIHRDLVRHGVNGFVVERGARNEIARCVNRLVNQPQIAASFSKAAESIAKSEIQNGDDVVRCFSGTEFSNSNDGWLACDVA